MTALVVWFVLTVPVVHVEIPSRVMVDEPFEVRISVTRDPKETVRSLEFGTIGRMVFGKATLVKTEKLDTGKVKDTYTLKARATVSDSILDRRVARLRRRMERWRASGDKDLMAKAEEAQKKLNKINKLYGFPSLPVLYVGADGKDGKVETPSFTRDEFTVLSPLDKVKDPQLHEPLAKKNLKSGGPRWRLFSVYQENVYLKYGLYGALAALALLALAWWVRKRWPLVRREEPPAPPKPPHEVAYEELARLGEMLPLTTPEEQEAFAFGLSEAIRRYFGARYGFDGLEMTVTEFMEEMERHRTPGVLKTDIHDFLERLEIVKFAKAPLSDGEARDLLERAHVYVERTYEPTEEELRAMEEEQASREVGDG